MIHWHKVLPLLVSPLWIALALMLVFLITQKRRYGWLAALVLVIPSIPVVSNQLTLWVEGPVQYRSANAAPLVDAVVVLSGSMSSKMQDGQVRWDLLNATRLQAGVALIQAKRAPKLVFTGGRQPWNPPGAIEGEALKQLAMAWGVRRDQIVVTDEVVNTQEEALAVSLVLPQPERRILLVTSAFHMPRAQTLFERLHFEVVAWPVDFRQSHDEFEFKDLLPQAKYLSHSTEMMRELLGRLYYQLKSW